MKVVNFWKTLFCSVLAITAFTACSDDDDNGYSGMPEITVNGGEVVTIAGKLAGGKLEQSVEVVSKGDWDLTFKNAGDSQWCTPSAMSGKTGTTTLTFTLGQATAERTAELKLTAYSTFEGIPLKREATIKVVQSDGDVPVGDALYSENCGTKVEKVNNNWPYVDQFEGWSRGGSLDQAAVAYAGSGASVRNSGAAYNPSDSEKGEVSGAPYVYLGSATAKFEIENINVSTNTNFTFTYTAMDQEKYSGAPVAAEVNASTVKFAVSIDGGTTYSPVAFTAKKVASGNWYLCTAEFKFPASASTDKISVRFDGYPFTGSNVDGHQGLRIDDFKLFAGGNGPELGEAPAIEYKKATISQITAAGNYQIDDAVVIANYQRGFLMQDATGIMQVYQYDKDSAPTPTVPSVGKKYTIKGVASSYGGLWQIGPTDLILENESTGTVPTPTLVTLDAAGMDALFAAPVIKYVKYTGELTIDGDYYNVNVNGATTVGSISYPNPGVVDANLNGKGVDVEGWFIGATGGKYFTTLGVKVTENAAVVSGEFTTQPTTFAATNPVAQTLNFTANAAAGSVTFELAGANADMFAYSDATTTTVKVNAKGNNTSSAAYAATLKLKAADGTVLDEVELKQERAASSTDKIITVAFEKQADFTAISYPYLYENRYVGDKSFTIDGYVYNFYAKTASYGIANNAGATYPSALFIGKKDSYIEFPAVAGYKLTSVLVRYGENMAAGNVLNIFSADNTAVSTPNAATTAADKGGSHVFECSETTVNTAYRLKMTADKNFQTNGWTLTYSKVD